MATTRCGPQFGESAEAQTLVAELSEALARGHSQEDVFRDCDSHQCHQEQLNAIRRWRRHALSACLWRELRI